MSIALCRSPSVKCPIGRLGSIDFPLRTSGVKVPLLFGVLLFPRVAVSNNIHVKLSHSPNGLRKVAV